MRMTPRVFLVAEVMYSSPWNMKKHWRLPMRRDDIDIAQKIAEFLRVEGKSNHLQCCLVMTVNKNDGAW